MENLTKKERKTNRAIHGTIAALSFLCAIFFAVKGEWMWLWINLIVLCSTLYEMSLRNQIWALYDKYEPKYDNIVDSIVSQNDKEFDDVIYKLTIQYDVLTYHEINDDNVYLYLSKDDLKTYRDGLWRHYNKCDVRYKLFPSDEIVKEEVNMYKITFIDDVTFCSKKIKDIKEKSNY